MEIQTKITLDKLNKNSVSVLTQQFVEINGESVQVGENHRAAFMNTTYGRIELAIRLPEPYLSSVLAVWGEEPLNENLSIETDIEVETQTKIE